MVAVRFRVRVLERVRLAVTSLRDAERCFDNQSSLLEAHPETFESQRNYSSSRKQRSGPRRADFRGSSDCLTGALTRPVEILGAE